MHFVLVSYTRSNHDPFTFLSPISFPSYSPFCFSPSPFPLEFVFLSLLLVRRCQSPGSLFELEEFMLPRHAPRSTNNHHRHFFVVPRADGLLWSLFATESPTIYPVEIGVNSLIFAKIYTIIILTWMQNCTFINIKLPLREIKEIFFRIFRILTHRGLESYFNHSD